MNGLGILEAIKAPVGPWAIESMCFFSILYVTMDDTVLKLGGVSLYGFGILATVTFLWGSFVFYKKAIDSHLEEQPIMDGIVLAGFWAFILGRLTFVGLNLGIFWNHFSRIFLFNNFPGIDRWGCLVGVFIGVYLVLRKFKLKIMDWFDLVSLASLSGSAIFLTGLTLLTSNWKYAFLGSCYLAVFIFAWMAEDRYRTYGW